MATFTHFHGTGQRRDPVSFVSESLASARPRLLHRPRCETTLASHDFYDAKQRNENARRRSRGRGGSRKNAEDYRENSSRPAGRDFPRAEILDPLQTAASRRRVTDPLSTFKRERAASE
jgi:hypothetical protein